MRFNPGDQRKLLIALAEKVGSLRKISLEWKIPYSTLKNYSSETQLLPELLFDKITTFLSLERDSLRVSYLSGNWGQIKGGKKSIYLLEKKYPHKLLQWRREAINKAIKEGTHYGIANRKVIKMPKLDERLAEIIGIYLGDGTLNKYQLRICGDSRYDVQYFNYISNLISELFGLSSSIKKEKYVNTLNLVVSSKDLCSYLRDNFNLNFGDKIRNKNLIPKSILEQRDLTIACLRGLVDTDGSISRRGRAGSQFCLHFSSYSPSLLNQVDSIGRNLGIFTYSDETGAGTNRWANILKYFELVGSSSLKHIIRFNLKFKENRAIYLNEVSKYLKQDFYRVLKLPFKLGPMV